VRTVTPTTRDRVFAIELTHRAMWLPRRSAESSLWRTSYHLWTWWQCRREMGWPIFGVLAGNRGRRCRGLGSVGWGSGSSS
jgi:hypothetical protein